MPQIIQDGWTTCTFPLPTWGEHCESLVINMPHWYVELALTELATPLVQLEEAYRAYSEYTDEPGFLLTSSTKKK